MALSSNRRFLRLIFIAVIAREIAWA